MGWHTLFVNFSMILHKGFDVKLVGLDLESDFGTLFGFHKIYLVQVFKKGGASPHLTIC